MREARCALPARSAFSLTAKSLCLKRARHPLSSLGMEARDRGVCLSVCSICGVLLCLEFCGFTTHCCVLRVCD